MGRMIVFAIVAGFSLSSCGSKASRFAYYFHKGQSYYAKNEYTKAGVELKDALQIEPKNSEAYYWYGLIKEKQQNFQAAFQGYANAVKLDPSNLLAKAKLGKFYLMAGHLAKAKKLVAEILSAQPDNPPGRVLKAALMARQGNVSGAIQEAKSVVAADPTQTDAISLLAAIYVNKSQYANAQQVLQQGVTTNPKSVQLRANLVVVLARLGHLKQAGQQLQDLIALDPSNFAFRLHLAQLYVTQKQPKKAEAVIRAAVQAKPEDERRYMALASLLASSGDVPAAEKELKIGISKVSSTSYGLRFVLAHLYAATNAPKKAEQEYHRIIELDKVGPGGLRARTRLAQMMLAEKRPQVAKKLISQVLGQDPTDAPALLVQGEMELVHRHPGAAIGNFRVVLHDQPNAVNVIRLLAVAHLMNHEPQLAVQTYEKAISQYPHDMAIRFSMVGMLVDMKKYHSATRQLQTVISMAPKSEDAVKGYIALAKVALIRRKPAVAVATFKKGLAAMPGNPTLMVSLAQVYQSEGHPNRAIATYTATIHRYPKLDIAANNLAALILSTRTDKADMIKALGLAKRFEHARNPALLDTLGWAYFKNHRYRHAIAVLEHAVSLAPQAGVLQYHLGMAYDKHNDRPDAVQHLKAAVASKGAFPEKATAVRELARLTAHGG
ncbi:MAG: tetratricopeptide repeat protein [Acidobacteriaceae bacterium]